MSVEVLIGHPGGPFWARKDDGAWSIPKGEYELRRRSVGGGAARVRRGTRRPAARRRRRIAFEPVKQPSGKVLTVFAVAADLDISAARSNTFTLEWPKGSGRMQEFPELDRVAWLPVAQARRKLLKGHVVFLDRLMAQPHLAGHSEGDPGRRASLVTVKVAVVAPDRGRGHRRPGVDGRRSPATSRTAGSSRSWSPSTPC